jgi:CheY-like chemotaxis protein
MPATREWLPPVMIVDDDSNDVALIRRLLDRAKVANPVLTFIDSEDALRFLRALASTPEAPLLRPAIMFLDIKMPKVHGFVLLKWVRRQPNLDDMAVVMLSGSDEPKDRERAAKLGADDYLVKLPPPEVMAATVAKWCPLCESG